MTDTTDTTEPEPAVTLAGTPVAEHEPEHAAAVSDLLSRLRLELTDHHFATVFGWLDDLAAKAKGDTTPADAAGTEPDADADDTTTASAPADTAPGEGGGVAAGGDAVPPIASGDAVVPPAAAQSDEPEPPVPPEPTGIGVPPA